MKIALVTLRFDAPGGVESTVAALAQGLLSAGQQVTVYASDLYDEGRWERRKELPPTAHGVPVRWFPVYKKLVPGVTMPLWVGLIDALREDAPDVIHAHSHRYGHVLEAALAARGTGIPLVVSPHYHPADRGEPEHKRMLLRGQDFLFGVSAYRVARRILVETQQEAAQLREFAPAPKVEVIPPGIDLTEWEEAKPPASVLPRGTPDKYLLFAGRIAPNKGLELLFEALARLDRDERLPLLIVGRDWGERSRLEDRARALGIDSYIQWVGHVPDRASYRAYFRHATGFVLPSEYEAFGLVLLEAMAARLPIVATAVGGVPEVLDGGGAGRLVPYGDPVALSAALRELRREDPAIGARVESARARVQEFSTQRMVERHLDVYRGICSALAS